MFFKKCSLIAIALALLLSSLTGCGPREEEQKRTMELPTEITIAYIAMMNSPTSPQAVVGRDKGIYDKYLKEHGVTINWVITRDRNNTAPLMAEDKVDFIYLPINNFSAYSSELSAFGGGDNFRLIAGSLESSSGYSLIVREGIDSLKDLDGKTVGIANDSLVTELALYHNLQAEAGLAPSAVGGTVEVKYQDYIHLLNEGFNNGEYDAIITRANFVDQALEENKNAKELILSPGKGAPSVNLLARKAIIDNFPDLTKSVLQAHIEATKDARTVPLEYLTELQIEAVKFYVQEVLGANWEPPSEDSIVRAWSRVDIVDVANISFLEELVDYMKRAGYYEGKDFDNFVDLRLLNEVLSEQR